MARKASEISRAMGKLVSIVGTLDVDIKASRMVCSVVAGNFLSTHFFPPNISRSAPGAGGPCVPLGMMLGVFIIIIFLYILPSKYV